MATQEEKDRKAKNDAAAKLNEQRGGSSRAGAGQYNRGYNYSSVSRDGTIHGNDPRTGAYGYDPRTQTIQGNIPNDQAQKIESATVRTQIEQRNIAERIKELEASKAAVDANWAAKDQTQLSRADRIRGNVEGSNLSKEISSLRATEAALKSQPTKSNTPNYSGVMATSGKIYENAAEAKKHGATVMKDRQGRDVTFEGDIRATAGIGQSNRGYNYLDTTDKEIVRGSIPGQGDFVVNKKTGLKEGNVPVEIATTYPWTGQQTKKIPVQEDYSSNFVTGDYQQSDTGFPQVTNNNVILNRSGTGKPDAPFKGKQPEEKQLAGFADPIWTVDTKSGKKTFQDKKDLEAYIKSGGDIIPSNEKMSPYNPNFIQRTVQELQPVNQIQKSERNQVSELGKGESIGFLNMSGDHIILTESKPETTYISQKGMAQGPQPQKQDPLSSATDMLNDFTKRKTDFISQLVGESAKYGVGLFAGGVEIERIIGSKFVEAVSNKRQLGTKQEFLGIPGLTYTQTHQPIKVNPALDSEVSGGIIEGFVGAYKTNDISKIGLGFKKGIDSAYALSQKQSLAANIVQTVVPLAPIIPSKTKSLLPFEYISPKIISKEGSKSVYQGLALKPILSKESTPLIGIQSGKIVLGHNPKLVPWNEITQGRYSGELALGSGGERAIFYSPKTMKYLVAENYLSPKTAAAAKKAIELEDATQAARGSVFVGSVDADAFKRISKTQGDYLLSKSAGLQKTDNIETVHGSLATRISMEESLKKEAGSVLHLGDLDIVPKLTKTEIKAGVSIEAKASKLIKEYHSNFPLAKGERLEFTDIQGQNRALSLISPQGKKEKIFEIVVKQSDQTPIGQKGSNPNKILDYKIPFEDTVKAVDYDIKAHTLAYQGLTQTKTILNFTQNKPRSILSNKPDDLQFHHLTKGSGKDLGIILTKDEHLGITALQGELGNIAKPKGSDKVLNLLGERAHKRYPLTEGYGQKVENILSNPTQREQVSDILSDAAKQVKNKDDFIGKKFSEDFSPNTLQYNSKNKFEIYPESGREKDIARRYWQGRQSDLNQIRGGAYQAAKNTKEKTEAFKAAHPEIDFTSIPEEKVSLNFVKPDSIVSKASKTIGVKPIGPTSSSFFSNNREDNSRSISPRSASSLFSSSAKPSSISRSITPRSSITPSSITSNITPRSTFSKSQASSKPSFSSGSVSIWSPSSSPSIRPSSSPSFKPSTSSIRPPIFSPPSSSPPITKIPFIPYNPLTPTRKLPPLIFDNKNTQRKRERKGSRAEDWLASSPTDRLEGLFSRKGSSDIIRGDKASQRQLNIDKKTKFSPKYGLGFSNKKKLKL